MADDISKEAAGADAGDAMTPGPAPALRKVPALTAEERQARRDAMERAIRFGAAPYRDAEGKARYVLFKEANDAPIEAWRRDPQAKRGFRKTQQARKAAGQLIWHPEDQIELAKRLGVIYYREGRSAEGAAERGLYDAIWRYEHVWEIFTTPRRIGPLIIDTGRLAALAEEEARKLQAEDPKAKGGFFVRDRKNIGLIYVVPNANPEAEGEGEITVGGGGNEVLVGQASTPPSPPARKPSASPRGNQPQSQHRPATESELFEFFLQKLGSREGGIANRPRNEDKGGPTKRGISKTFLDKLRKLKEYAHLADDPRNLTDAQIDAIYRAEKFDRPLIWKLAQVPGLWAAAPQLVEQMFDAGVLHGILDPGKWFQQALDEVMGTDLRTRINGKLDYDGIIGSKTRRVAEQAVLAGKIVEVNNIIVDKRRAYMKTLPEFPSNPGWLPRAELFRNTSVLSSGQVGKP